MTALGALVERIEKLEAELAKVKAFVRYEPPAVPTKPWVKPRLNENLDPNNLPEWAREMAAASEATGIDANMRDVVRAGGPPRLGGKAE